MNIGVILLVIILLSMLAEVFIGIKRGIALTGVRVILWVLGTFVAALCAKSLAKFIVLKVAAANSMNGTTVAEAATAALKNAGLGSLAEVLSVPLAGLSLSAMIPVAFVLLFVVAKLVTLGLYFAAKACLKRSKASDVFTERPTWSKAAGGVVGGLVAIVTCAIIVSPVTGLLKTINDSGSADSIFHILEVTTGGKQAAGKIAEFTPVRIAIELNNSENYGIGAVKVYAADNDGEDGAVNVIGGADGPTVVVVTGVVGEIKDVYDSLVDSPAEFICKYTGAEGIAMGIYHATSDVSASDVGAEGAQDMSYNFPQTVSDVMEITDAIDTTVTLLNDGSGLSSDLVDSVSELIDFALDTDIMNDEDKLAVLNESVPMIQTKINDALGLDEGTEFFGTYSSLDDFRQDVSGVVEIAHVVADSDAFSNGFDNVDVDALLNDAMLMKDFIHSTMALSNGPVILASIVNSKVNDLSKGKIPSAVSETSIANAGEDRVVSTFTKLIGLKDYMGRTSLTEAERADITAKADEIESYGVISDAAIKEVRSWVE